LPLTGSGANLPLPPDSNIGVYPPGTPYTDVVEGPGTFNGTFKAPASPAWLGTFKATGPVPGSGKMGKIKYDFSGLAAGFLPAGSFFNFGDLDFGSVTSEVGRGAGGRGGGGGGRWEGMRTAAAIACLLVFLPCMATRMHGLKARGMKRRAAGRSVAAGAARSRRLWLDAHHPRVHLPAADKAIYISYVYIYTHRERALAARIASAPALLVALPPGPPRCLCSRRLAPAAPS
jgi:hypothetical protein